MNQSKTTLIEDLTRLNLELFKKTSTQSIVKISEGLQHLVSVSNIVYASMPNRDNSFITQPKAPVAITMTQCAMCQLNTSYHKNKYKARESEEFLPTHGLVKIKQYEYYRKLIAYEYTCLDKSLNNWLRRTEEPLVTLEIELQGTIETVKIWQIDSPPDYLEAFIWWGFNYNNKKTDYALLSVSYNTEVRKPSIVNYTHVYSLFKMAHQWLLAASEHPIGQTHEIVEVKKNEI